MENTWNNVRMLRHEQEQLLIEGKPNLSWQVRYKADRMETELLRSDIKYLTQLYNEYMMYGKKTDLKGLGVILRKKQIRLEQIMRG